MSHNPAVGSGQTSAWLAVTSLALGTFSFVASEFLPASLLPRMAQDLHISAGAAGQAVTATAVAAALAAPTVAIVSRSLDRRYLVSGLSALLVLSNLAVWFADNLWSLVIARLILGVALGGFWSIASALVARLVPPDSFGRAMSAIMTGVAIATVCAPPAGAWIGELWGWRVAFLVAALAGLVTLVTQLTCLPPLPPRVTSRLTDLVRVLGHSTVRLGLGACVLIGAGHFAVFTYVGPLLDQSHVHETQRAGFLLIFGLSGLVGSVAAGHLIDRGLLDVCVAPLTIGTACMILAAGSSPAVTATMLALWGLAYGALNIGLNTWMARAAPNQMESIGGAFIATFQVAVAIGSAAGGVLVDTAGPRSTTFTGGALCLGGGLLFYWLDHHKTQQRDVPPVIEK